MLAGTARLTSRLVVSFRSRAACTRKTPHVRQFSDLDTGHSISSDRSQWNARTTNRNDTYRRELYKEENQAVVDGLLQVYPPYSIVRFRVRNPWMPLSDLLEIVTLLRSLPAELPANVPDAIERRIVEIFERAPLPPRVVSHELAQFTRLASYEKLRAEPLQAIARIVERLLRIAWHNGDTDCPRAGTHLISPTSIKGISGVRNYKSLLCSEEEAARIYTALQSTDEEMATLTWARRLDFLRRKLYDYSLRNQDERPSPSQLRRDFSETMWKIEELYKKSSSDDFKAMAMTFLGKMYALGRIVGRDGQKARVYWERAIRDTPAQYHAHAALFLGQVYIGQQPESWGEKDLFVRDFEQGLAYYEIAKKMVPKAALELGRRYYRLPWMSEAEHLKERGVEANDERAAENFYIGICMRDESSSMRFAEMILLGRAQPRPIPARHQEEASWSLEQSEDPEGETGVGLHLALGQEDSAAQATEDVNQYVIDLLKPFYDFRTKAWCLPPHRRSPIRQLIQPQFEKMADKLQRETRERESGGR